MNGDDKGRGDGIVDGLIAALRGEINDLRSALEETRAGFERKLREVEAENAGLSAGRDALAERVAGLERRSHGGFLPVLCRDLARWSDAGPGSSSRTRARPVSVSVAVAVAVGPPPLPPSLDDLTAVEAHLATLKTLLATPNVAGKPFHGQFDEERLKVLQARLREANQQAERLLSQIERSKTNKDLLWHLMVAKRNEEVNRKRRG